MNRAVIGSTSFDPLPSKKIAGKPRDNEAIGFDRFVSASSTWPFNVSPAA
jgi:hypothetical protein